MPKFHPLVVREIRRETPECVSISFEVPEALHSVFQFVPGQYLTLKASINGKEARRNYSICTSLADNDLRVAVKKLEGGLFSTFANEKLKKGALLDVMPPEGNFCIHLEKNKAKNYVAFASGSGITPVMSMLKSTLEEEPQSHFTLFYGNRKTEDIIFMEALEALKSSYMQRLSIFYLLSGEKTGSDLFDGRITQEKCNVFFDKVIDVAEVDGFFLCGPEEMIRSVEKVLLSKGVDPVSIHFELFTIASPEGRIKKTEKKAQTQSVQASITAILDDETFSFNYELGDESLIDAALNNDIDLPFACKGGVCCTCKAKVVEGKVEMEKNYALEQEQLDAGFVLTCQSKPLSEKVVLDFDA